MNSRQEMTGQEQEALEQAAKYGHCWLLRRCAQAILLLGRGRIPAEVAEILDTRKITFTSGGAIGGSRTSLAWRSVRIPVAPGSLDGEQSAYLAPLVASGAYSVRQLMVLMQVTWPDFQIHPGSLRRILHPHGFRWERTRYALKNGRRKRIYRPAVTWPNWASAGRGEIDLVYFDEFGFSVNPFLGSSWTSIGEQKAGDRQRHSRRLNVLGCLLHGELAWQNR